jgi:hypothetical protein
MKTDAADIGVISERRALESATRRLSEEFAGIYGADVVESYLMGTYRALSATATVRQFLGVLVERETRARLRALASAPKLG